VYVTRYCILRAGTDSLQYNQRLFVLDAQVRHLDFKSLNTSGQWLARKWMLCQKKKKAALEGLTELGTDEDILREEWAAQVAHQTKPIARKSFSEFYLMGCRV
jgi:hypothetical protein